MQTYKTTKGEEWEIQHPNAKLSDTFRRKDGSAVRSPELTTELLAVAEQRDRLREALFQASLDLKYPTEFADDLSQLDTIRRRIDAALAASDKEGKP